MSWPALWNPILNECWPNSPNQRLILWLQRFLYCLFLTRCAFIWFLLTIFLLFSFMNSHTITIMVRKTIFIHLSSEGPLVQRQDNVLTADYHDRTMSHCKIHKAITITSRCRILHQSEYRGVLSVLSLYIRGSRTLSDPRPRSKGQSRCT